MAEDLKIYTGKLGTIIPNNNFIVDKTTKFINKNKSLTVSDVLKDVKDPKHAKRIRGMFALMEPPNFKEISNYLTGAHSVDQFPKTEIMANPYFPFCDMIHRGSLFAFDSHKEQNKELCRKFKSASEALNMTSIDIYMSRTCSRALRYSWASNAAKAKLKEAEEKGEKPNDLVPHNKMVIDHLRAARTLLRRLPPWAPFPQTILLRVTASLAAECYSVREDILEKIYSDAYRLYKRLLKTPLLLSDDETGRAFHNVANILERKGDIFDALNARLAALKCFQIFYYPETEHTNIAAMYLNAGLMYDQCGDKINGLKFKEIGHEMLLRVTKIEPSNTEPISERIATSLNNLGVAYQEIGYAEKGIRLQGEALEMRRKIYNGEPHEKIAQSLNNLGSALETTPDRSRGIAMLYEAIEMNHVLCKAKGKTLPYKSRALAMNHANLGSALMHSSGNLEEAKKHLLISLDMFRTHGEGQVEHENIAISENNIGIVFEKLGNREEGLKHKIISLQLRKKIYGKKSSESLATSLCCVGEGYCSQEKYSERTHKLGLNLVMCAIQMFKNIGSGNIELLLAVSTALPKIDDVYEAADLAVEFLPLFVSVIREACSYHRVQLTRTFARALSIYGVFDHYFDLQAISASYAEEQEQRMVSGAVNRNRTPAFRSGNLEASTSRNTDIESDTDISLEELSRTMTPRGEETCSNVLQTMVQKNPYNVDLEDCDQDTEIGDIGDYSEVVTDNRNLAELSKAIEPSTSVFEQMVLELAFLNKYKAKKFVPKSDILTSARARVYKNGLAVTINDQDIQEAKKIFDDPVGDIMRHAKMEDNNFDLSQPDFDENLSPYDDFNVSLMEKTYKPFF